MRLAPKSSKRMSSTMTSSPPPTLGSIPYTSSIKRCVTLSARKIPILSYRPRTPYERPIEGQQYDRSKGGHQNRPDVEPRYSPPAEQLHDETSDQCSYHPDDDGEQEAAGVPARHDQLAQDAGNQPDHDPAYDAYTHLLLLPPLHPVLLAKVMPPFRRTLPALIGRGG